MRDAQKIWRVASCALESIVKSCKHESFLPEAAGPSARANNVLVSSDSLKSKGVWHRMFHCTNITLNILHFLWYIWDAQYFGSWLYSRLQVSGRLYTDIFCCTLRLAAMVENRSCNLWVLLDYTNHYTIGSQCRSDIPQTIDNAQHNVHFLTTRNY
jgi:hypothetical protein